MAINLILAEGKDDEHVIKHILRAFDVVEGRVDVKDIKGIDNLIEALPVELKGSELSCLGIVIDADTDVASRWQSVSAIFQKAGYITLPKKPDSNGTIVSATGMPTVGIWIMPDNEIAGMVENFVSFLVPQGDDLWGRAVEVVENIDKSMRRFPEIHKAKAEIHTWLAWQKEPGTPFGLAITKKYLDPHCEEGRKFFDWLQRLFTL